MTETAEYLNSIALVIRQHLISLGHPPQGARIGQGEDEFQTALVIFLGEPDSDLVCLDVFAMVTPYWFGMDEEEVDKLHLRLQAEVDGRVLTFYRAINQHEPEQLREALKYLVDSLDAATAGA